MNRFSGIIFAPPDITGSELDELYMSIGCALKHGKKDSVLLLPGGCRYQEIHTDDVFLAKSCNYCGRINKWNSFVCLGCGASSFDD